MTRTGRVVVTGGAGFLGSHLCDALIGRGQEVVCLDNMITGQRENIAHLIDNPRFTYSNIDVSSHVTIDGPVDAVMHLASPASPRDFTRVPIQILKAGSRGTQNCLGLAKAKNAKFLLTSTSEVYGDPLVHPQPESYWGNVNPVGPRGVYDEAKRFGEAITMAYHHAHDIDVRIVRVFNTYGPRMRPNDGRVVSNFVTQAVNGDPISIYGDGSQSRSFCYVDDQVDGLLAMLDGPFLGPVNIGNDVEFTVLELAKLVLQLTESRSDLEYLPLPVDDPVRRRPDLRLAFETLKWKPTVGLEDGLRKTVEYFRSHPAR